MINNWNSLLKQLVLPSPIVELRLPDQMQSYSLHVKREDLIHPVISGNKWRKLKYNLLEAALNNKRIISFGGAFSNHIYALAGASRILGLETTLYIRGAIDDLDNPTLRFCREAGVKLVSLTREDYRHRNNPEFIQSISYNDPSTLVIPEGGSNALAYKGLMELSEEISAVHRAYDYIAISAGTGMSAASLIDRFDGKVAVYPALKGDFIKDEISSFMKSENGFLIRGDHHFGGYGKTSRELTDFINIINKRYSMPLDPIYTAKVFYGIYSDMSAGFFPTGSRILMIHSGGLQGIEAYNYRWRGKYGAIK